jgi:hypothetical protein
MKGPSDGLIVAAIVACILGILGAGVVASLAWSTSPFVGAMLAVFVGHTVLLMHRLVNVLVRRANGRNDALLSRDDLLLRVRALLDGRPVRWVAPLTVVGNPDIREREPTLEIFNADPSEQRALYHRLRRIRSEIEAEVGGSFVVVFHTRAESARSDGAMPT